MLDQSISDCNLPSLNHGKYILSEISTKATKQKIRYRYVTLIGPSEVRATSGANLGRPLF